MIILAIDGLEYEYVKKFNCKHLMQEFHGKTDISEFTEPRTMVLWSSFITGKNKEKDVLKDGNKEMWDKKWPINETFFSRFKSPVVIDLPGFSYNKDIHDKSRELLKKFFNEEENKEDIKTQYNKEAFSHHKEIKKQFFKALEEDHDLILAYFSVADIIGHLNFGNNIMMKMIYDELDDIAKEIKDKKPLILSDHGMKAIGMFGDHSNYGFWSYHKDLKTPKITEFQEHIKGK